MKFRHDTHGTVLQYQSELGQWCMFRKNSSTVYISGVIISTNTVYQNTYM